MDKLVFNENRKAVAYATESGSPDYIRGMVVFRGLVGSGAAGSTEAQLREAFALFRKRTGQPEPCAKTWIQFDPTNPPAPGDYWCEVPALKLRNGGCLCRALYWTGEHWEGPGGEYEVGRYMPKMLEQLHGHGVVNQMDEGADQWKLDAAIARIREIEKERDRATKLFELVSAERNELVRRANRLERLISEMAGPCYDTGYSPADTIRSLRENLYAATARAEEADARIVELEAERDSMALRIERMSAELAKPEDERMREVTEAMSGRAVMFDDIAALVRHELYKLDTWIERAGKAERERDKARRLCSTIHECAQGAIAALLNAKEK